MVPFLLLLLPGVLFGGLEPTTAPAVWLFAVVRILVGRPRSSFSYGLAIRMYLVVHLVMV